MLFSRKNSASTAQARLDQANAALLNNVDQLDQAKPFFPALTKILLITGLGILSWLATYTGMLELIVANAGQVDFGYKLAIAFAVAMLMLMIIYILDSLFSPISWWIRFLYVGGYIFLTLISVGFGFGFYWKFLESRSEATRSAESAIGQVQTALQGGQTRLEQLQVTLDTLTTLSSAKAEEERTKGRTCQNSPPGDGPRRRLRDADAKNFQFAGDFVRSRVGTVKNDISALNTEMAKLTGNDASIIDPKTGTRNLFLKGLNRNLELTIARFNAFRTDPQLRQFRDGFASRSEQTVFNNGSGGSFKCPDPQLQSALRGVVKAIDGLPDLEKPEVSAVEGSEAIVEAFRRLTTTTIGVFKLKLPPSPDELRALQQKAVQSVESKKDNSLLSQKAGLGERDYIPLFIAIFVDICILLVSINRPVNRMQKLMANAREARAAQAHQVFSSIRNVHDSNRTQRLDVFHDVMFDARGEQYVAVPLAVFDENTGLQNPENVEARKKKVMEARYLSTLLAALEAGGLCRQVWTFRQNTIRSKLERIGSRFANAGSYRIYCFASGAWPAIVLDDMLGASAEIDMENTLRREREAEERTLRGPELTIDSGFAAYDRAEPSFTEHNGWTADYDLKIDDQDVRDNQAAEPAFEDQSVPEEKPYANGHSPHLNSDELPVFKESDLNEAITIDTGNHNSHTPDALEQTDEFDNNGHDLNGQADADPSIYSDDVNGSSSTVKGDLFSSWPETGYDDAVYTTQANGSAVQQNQEQTAENVSSDNAATTIPDAESDDVTLQQEEIPVIYLHPVEEEDFGRQKTQIKNNEKSDEPPPIADMEEKIEPASSLAEKLLAHAAPDEVTQPASRKQNGSRESTAGKPGLMDRFRKPKEQTSIKNKIESKFERKSWAENYSSFRKDHDRTLGANQDELDLVSEIDDSFDVDKITSWYANKGD